MDLHKLILILLHIIFQTNNFVESKKLSKSLELEATKTLYSQNYENALVKYISNILSFEGLHSCSLVLADIFSNAGSLSDLPPQLSRLYATSIVISSKGISNLQEPSSYQYIRRTKRHLSSCALVIAEVSTNNLERLQNFLTQPILLPLTIRNRDFYIFITANPLQLNSMLLDEQIIYNYKYKIGIASGTREGLRVISACMYCNGGGPSKIIELDKKLTTQEKLYPDFLKNLYGKLMRAVVFAGGYSSQLRCIDGSCAPFKTGGVALRTFLIAAKHFNFTYTMWPSKVGGRKLGNGTWVGITGDILHDRADFGLVNAINLGRMTVVDLSYIIQYVKIAFVYVPPDYIYSWMSVFWPLSSKLWGLIGLTTATSAFFLHILNQSGESVEHQKTWSFSTTVQFLISSYCCQAPYNPRILPVRVFASCWYLCILIITTAYLSKMFDIFMSPPREKAPNDFKELAQSDFDIHMTYYGGAITEYFRKSPLGSSSRSIYERWKPQSILGCHIIALKTHKSTCISWDGATELAINVQLGDKHGRTNLIMKPSNDLEFHLSIAMEKRWIFTQNFNRVVSSLVECGFLDFWKFATFTDLRRERFQKEILNTTSNHTSMTDAEGLKCLTIKHLTGAFVLFHGGMFLACLAFLADFYIIFTEAFKKIVVQKFIAVKLLRMRRKSQILRSGGFRPTKILTKTHKKGMFKNQVEEYIMRVKNPEIGIAND